MSGAARKRRNKKRGEAVHDGKRLREEGEKVMEAVKRASRASFTLGGGSLREGGLVLVPGQDAGGGTNLSGDIVFQLKGLPSLAVTFLPDYQVEAEMEMTLTVQEFTDNTYLLEKEVSFEQPLCPEVHPLVLSPTCSLLSFYNRVDVTYHHSYTDPLDNVQCGAANMLVKVGALEASFGTPPGIGVPVFNRGREELRSSMKDWPADTQTGFRQYRARIPRFPFRRLSPWQQPRVQATLGKSVQYPTVGIIPPDTDMRVLFRRETRVPDLLLLYPWGGNLGKYASSGGGDKELTQTETREWRRYQLPGDTEGAKPRYFEIQSLKPKIRKIHLVVKHIHFCQDPWPWPVQLHSVYRSLSLELSKATSQVHLINWDLPHLPATLFLMFLREMEVMSGGAGIGDTASKLNQLLSTAPDLSFRPLKLQELKLVDNTQPTLDRGVEALALEGMTRQYPDRSLRQYVEHLRSV